jgi:signal transduction histidine kinase
VPNLTVKGFSWVREAVYLASLFMANMPPNLSGIENLITNLIHDLRQPLANLEGCSYYLSSFSQSGDARIQELAQVIERQVAHAEELLSAASQAVSQMRVQRQEEAASIEFTNPANAGVT